jgi:hypothetical protein
MALKNLSSEEMAAVSGAWVDAANPASGALAKIERLQALIPQVKERHAEVLTVLPVRGQDPDREALIARATELDAVHDGLAGAIYGYLSAIAQLTDDGAELIDLRDQLMPDGLGAIVQATYRGQAGYAAALSKRMNASLRRELKELALPDGTLLDKVEAWIAAALALGELEEGRARNEAARPRLDSAQVVIARNGWIRVANALQAVAQLAELEPGVDGLLFGPLRDAELTADLRAARRSAATQARRTAGVSDVAPKLATETATPGQTKTG